MQIPFYRDLRLGFPAGGSLYRHWRDNRPDVIYIATEGPLGLSALRTARRLEIPTVSGFHTNFQSYSNHYGIGFLRPLVEAYLRYFHRRTGCTLAPNAELCQELSERGFGDIRVLPRGVDSELYSPARRNAELRQHWGVDDDQLVVLYVGRIAAEKNIQEAINAFRAMQLQQNNLKFVLVGDGPQRAKLAAANPDFHFAGVRTGIPLAEHYASADLFLFPSKTETFGNVTLEAMASALPVIAYDYAAANMHIRQNETGLLVPLDTPGAFERTATEIIRYTTQLRTIGSAARAYTEQLSWQRIIADFETILRERLTPEENDYAEEH
jgi:glycosyltransferase involved in cell wall biosynthesis